MAEYSSFLPFFIWVLRDFSLNLNSKAPQYEFHFYVFNFSLFSEYLTSCLTPVEGANESENDIRTTLASYFKERDCHCLVKPLNDENQLKEIANVPVKKMKPLFM